MKSKYIKFRPLWRSNKDDTDDFCVVFPEVVKHVDVAEAMSGAYRPISAGFVGMDNYKGVYAYGESTSLKLESYSMTDNLLLSFALRGVMEE